MAGLKPCPDCGVPAGKAHTSGCDVARCLFTGGQRIQCDREDHRDCGKDVWSGEWPGTAECREFGWLRENDWPDLNRLFFEAAWDRERARWVRLA